MSPKVSVIIPNYNHASYLPRRIESVLHQTFQDFEVLLLDDFSNDNSQDVIAHYAEKDQRIRVILNDKNSGSTFKQWNKGIALAKGQYVWIAESDDFAAINFLETLVSRLDSNPDVVLSYCDSYSVDEFNELMPVPTWEPFLAELDDTLWKHDFLKPGKELIQRFMSYRNIIPNASAVVLRHSILMQIGSANESMRIVGDWLFWAKVMSKGTVSYTARPLNYFRTHRNNVRTKTVTSGIALVEATQIPVLMKQYGTPDPLFYNKSVDLLIWLWLDAMTKYRIPLKTHQKIYQNILQLGLGIRLHLLRASLSFLARNKFGGARAILKNILNMTSYN